MLVYVVAIVVCHITVESAFVRQAPPYGTVFKIWLSFDHLKFLLQNKPRNVESSTIKHEWHTSDKVEDPLNLVDLRYVLHQAT